MKKAKIIGISNTEYIFTEFSVSLETKKLEMGIYITLDKTTGMGGSIMGIDHEEAVMQNLFNGTKTTFYYPCETANEVVSALKDIEDIKGIKIELI